MAGTQFEAKLDEDGIVVRIPLAAIMALIEKENLGAPDKIVVVDANRMLDGFCNEIIVGTLFKEQILAQVDAMIEMGYKCVSVKRAQRDRAGRLQSKNDGACVLQSPSDSGRVNHRYPHEQDGPGITLGPSCICARGSRAESALR
ncbi:hypothetical protein [Bradyrhizobium sp. McL0616]|uniref:hypothetical protein n=1 Tax=Bradyrhizobium sp. McL0616 TaxID=3415674 RepID=UPI003CEFE0D7